MNLRRISTICLLASLAPSAARAVTAEPIGAPPGATYITKTEDPTLSAEQALSPLSTGLMQVTTSTGVVSSVTTSAGVSSLLSDETGSGALVFGTSPSFTTSALFPAGSAAAPGLAFSADSDGSGTGVYRSGANQIGLSANGVNVWNISATGHVLAATDNTFDIGASGATRPRTGYFATSLISGAGSTATPSLAFSNSTDSGLYARADGAIGLVANGNSVAEFFESGGAYELRMRSTAALSWSSGAADLSADTAIVRDAANIVAQRNGTNAQEFRLYNKYDGSNYERLRQKWSSDVLYIGPEAGGSGTKRCMVTHGAAEKTLAQSTTTAFVRIACPLDTHVGGIIHYTIHAQESGDAQQARTGSIHFSIVNVQNVETVVLGTPINEAVVLSTGTLNATFSTSNSPSAAVDILVNATTSLTFTSLAIRYRVEIFGPSQTVTPQ